MRLIRMAQQGAVRRRKVGEWEKRGEERWGEEERRSEERSKLAKRRNETKREETRGREWKRKEWLWEEKGSRGECSLRSSITGTQGR
jgi:hypothetical protein